MCIDFSKTIEHPILNKFLKSDKTLTKFGIFSNKYSVFFKEKFSIPDEYFYPLDDGQKSLILNTIESKMEKMTNSKARPNYKDIVNVMKVFNDINKIFIKKPKALIIKNSNNEKKFGFQYDLSALFSDNNKEETLEMLRFISNEVVDIAFELSKLSIESENNQNIAEIERLKKTIERKAEAEMKKLFQDFDIYAQPIFKIEGQILKLNVQPKNEYVYNDNIKTENNSDGYKSLLSVLFNFRTHLNKSKIDEKNNYIFLVDEPDKNIHPISQMMLLNYFEDNIKDRNIAVVLTTHSPFLVSKSNNIKKLVVYRDSEGKTNLNEISSINSVSFRSHYINFVSEVLSKEDFSKKFLNKNIILNGKNEESFKKLKEKIEAMAFGFKVNVFSKDEFNKSFHNIIESVKIEFVKSKNDRNEISKFLETYNSIEIDEDQIEEIE